MKEVHPDLKPFAILWRMAGYKIEGIVAAEQFSEAIESLKGEVN